MWFLRRPQAAERPGRADSRRDFAAGTRFLLPAAEYTQLRAGMLSASLIACSDKLYLSRPQNQKIRTRAACATKLMLRIQPAIGERLQPALELLFSALPAKARTRRIAEVRQEIEDGDFDPKRLLLAESDSTPVGVQLTVIRDDDVGMVWPPVVAVELQGLSSDAIEDALLSEAVIRLDKTKAWIGQSLLEPGQTREHAALQRNGFTRLTELRFFERLLSDTSDRQQRETNVLLNYEPFRRTRNRAAFVNVLEATYRGSLDCPEFNGVRDGQQSLKNHEAAGSFTSDMWRLYSLDEVDLGVLLLVERPDQQAWEVL